MSGRARSGSDGWMLRAYLWLRSVLQPAMRSALKQRIRQGKDDPTRSNEKLGIPGQPRPNGRLVWFHAVGLGEVLALRPLISAMQAQAPDINVLVTSSARSTAQALQSNLPPRSQHQFLPLDGPDFVSRFLEHWKPDLSVWSEQDLWPGIVCDVAAAGIPLAYVNVRMNATSLGKRLRVKRLYQDTLARFAYLSAQDAQSAKNLEELSGRAVDGVCSLKPASEPLAADPYMLETYRASLSGRRVWVAASTHASDEPLVLSAHKELMQQDPSLFLILAPRDAARAREVAGALEAAGLFFSQRSDEDLPSENGQVYLADSYGELGVWYRLASAAYIGGSMGDVEGHNPWEAICLGVPVVAGPRTSNFRDDYNALTVEGLVRRVEMDATGRELADAILDSVKSDTLQRAAVLVEVARAQIPPLAKRLVDLMEDAT